MKVNQIIIYTLIKLANYPAFYIGTGQKDSQHAIEMKQLECGDQNQHAQKDSDSVPRNGSVGIKMPISGQSLPQSKWYSPSSEAAVFVNKYAKQEPLEADDIEVIAPVEIDEATIPGRLMNIDYPRSGDSHDEDAVKVIRKNIARPLNVHGSRESRDLLAVLASKHQLPGNFATWKAQLEAAVDQKDEEFLKKVIVHYDTLHIF